MRIDLITARCLSPVLWQNFLSGGGLPSNQFGTLGGTVQQLPYTLGRRNIKKNTLCKLHNTGNLLKIHKYHQSPALRSCRPRI